MHVGRHGAVGEGQDGERGGDGDGVLRGLVEALSVGYLAAELAAIEVDEAVVDVAASSAPSARCRSGRARADRSLPGGSWG